MSVKIGEYIYYKSVKQDSLCVGSGLVLDVNEEYVSILDCKNYSNYIERIRANDVVPIEYKNNLIELINDFYDGSIKKLESQLKSVKRSDYQEDIKKQYLLLKYEILNTCANMTEDIDDCDFENKLKAICEKKKQLFSIKCEEMNDARKFNGEIKYRIREIQNKRYHQINNLDESINKIKKVLN